MPNYRAIREQAGWSQLKAAVDANVAPQTLRVWELRGEDAIRDAEKRRSLSETYARLQAIAAARVGRAA